MLRTSLVSAAVALAVWFAFGVIGPFPVFRAAENTGVSIAEFDAYQNYLRQSQAGTWDTAKPAVTPPLARDIYQGVSGRNFLISGAIAVFGAVVIVFGLSGIATQMAKTYHQWQETRRYPPNGRVDREEQRTGEREPARTYR